MTKKAKKRMPEFQTIEEAADFFDTHDLREFEDQFEDVEIEFARPLIHSLQLDFDAVALGRLFAAGTTRGANPVDLARSWILERLEQESPVVNPPPLKARKKGAGIK